MTKQKLRRVVIGLTAISALSSASPAIAAKKGPPQSTGPAPTTLQASGGKVLGGSNSFGGGGEYWPPALPVPRLFDPPFATLGSASSGTPIANEPITFV